MKKMIIIFGATLLVISGGCGYFIYSLSTSLAKYESFGTYAQLQRIIEEKENLTRQNTKQERKLEKIAQKFIKYREQQLTLAEFRAKRRASLGTAAFSPVSGPYILAALIAQEQLELCQSSQNLTQLEIELLENPDPEVMMQQEKICGVHLDKKLLSLFKYEVLRIKASMTGSLKHLRLDAENKIDVARKLLEDWSVPVNSELDSYARFK